MAYRRKIGLLAMALLEDDYNKTAHVRPMAQKAADRIGGILEAFGGTVCPPLVKEEHQAETVAQMFDQAGVDLIVAEGESSPIRPRPVAASQMLYKPAKLRIAAWCDAWLKAGAPHHMALAYGHLGDKLRKVAELGGLDYLEI